MKNTMSPSASTATATTALALSLLQAPASAEARGPDATPPPEKIQLSHVERALVNGSTSGALKVIESSALKDVRLEVVKKDLPEVGERVVKQLVVDGRIEDAQRVVIAMREFSPESAHRGALQAFATLDKESFEKFCDRSIWCGAKPYAHIREELISPAQQNGLSPSKAAEMLETMDRADTARTKAQVGLEVGAFGATGIAAAAGAHGNKSFLSRAVRTAGGLAAVAGGQAVFASLFGTYTSLWSIESFIVGGSLYVSALGLQQIFKGIGLVKDE